ncbi:unnamed protein product [Closterium sp. NIES-65]|nr:unnamed protein product [Closterium sp. NIES-65]
MRRKRGRRSRRGEGGAVMWYGAAGVGRARGGVAADVSDCSDVYEFVKRMRPLLDLEKDAEVALAEEAASTRSLASAQAKGRVLCHLRCSEALLTLASNKTEKECSHARGGITMHSAHVAGKGGGREDESAGLGGSYQVVGAAAVSRWSYHAPAGGIGLGSLSAGRGSSRGDVAASEGTWGETRQQLAGLYRKQGWKKWPPFIAGYMTWRSWKSVDDVDSLRSSESSESCVAYGDGSSESDAAMLSEPLVRSGRGKSKKSKTIWAHIWAVLMSIVDMGSGRYLYAMWAAKKEQEKKELQQTQRCQSQVVAGDAPAVPCQ